MQLVELSVLTRELHKVQNCEVRSNLLKLGLNALLGIHCTSGREALT
jgi:hypothetical protein